MRRDGWGRKESIDERNEGRIKRRRGRGMDGKRDVWKDTERKLEKRSNLITLLRSGIVYSFSLTSHITNSPTSGTKCSLLLH